MVTLPSWNSIEEDVKLAMLLIADGMMNVLGGGPRAIKAAEAFLDIKLPEGFTGFIVNEATEHWSSGDPGAFMASIKPEDTHLYGCVKRAHSLLSEMKPIHLVSYHDEKDEAIYWLDYFITAIPTDSYGTGDDYSSIVFDGDRALPALRDGGHAYLSLIEFVQSMLSAPEGWDADPDFQSNQVVFTGQDIARLAGVDIRSVRNAMGPKGDKPIRSFRLSIPVDDDRNLFADPIDAIEWLSGRRGFRSGRLEASYVDTHVRDIRSRKALGALAGMMFWLNGRTTTDMATALDWDAEQVRAWTRGFIDTESAEKVALAAGLDPTIYAAQISTLLEAQTTPSLT